jgi:guanylate kinase
MLFILSAPSGAGKTTIAHRMLERFPALRFSVSATTRPRRPAERDGVDYHFLTPERFDSLIAEGGFVEYEEVFGNRYGTLVAEVDRAVAEGAHLLFDVDVKGALSLLARYGEQAVLIFIRPPDRETLLRRLRARHTDSEEVIAQRLHRMDWELEQAPRFRHSVVNDDLETAVADVAAIIERTMRGRA